jgi:hypothetical protein
MPQPFQSPDLNATAGQDPAIADLTLSDATLLDRTGPVLDKLGPLLDKTEPLLDKTGPVLDKTDPLAIGPMAKLTSGALDVSLDPTTTDLPPPPGSALG